MNLTSFEKKQSYEKFRTNVCCVDGRHYSATLVMAKEEMEQMEEFEVVDVFNLIEKQDDC